MSKRTDYHRDYYRANAPKLSERKQEERDRFERATSYWRHKLCFGRELPWLIKDVSPDVVERARAEYQKVLDLHEPDDVEKNKHVSTGRSRGK